MGLSERFKTFKPFLIACLILVTAVAVFALLKATKPQPEAQPVSGKRWPVSTLKVQPASYTPQVSLLGKTESPFQIQVTAAVNGYIKHIHALEGDLLPKGQILFELDPRDSQVLLQQRRADLDTQNALLSSEKLQQENNRKLLTQDQALLELNKSSVERLKALVRQGSAAQSALDEAQQALIRQKMTLANREFSIRNFDNRLLQLTAQRDKARALYQQAQLDLERTQAKAPFNARVSSLMVAPGDRVSPGKVLATLYPQEQLELRAQLPGDLLAHIRQASEGDTSSPLKAVAHYQQKTLPLELRSLGAQVRSGQGGIDAFFRLLQPVTTPSDGQPEALQPVTAKTLPLLPTGQSLAITLYLPEVHQAIALPGTAFYGQNRIYLVEKGTLISRTVTRLGTLQSPDGQLRILISSDGIGDNSQILTTQLPNAITGLPVRVVNESESHTPGPENN